MKRKAYPSDLTDDQWKELAPLLPPAKPGGRHRTVDLREVINGILYVPAERMPVACATPRPSALGHRVVVFPRVETR
ncbi:MAG: transposase, partial [Chloroflexi bacterium]|nr:transposase [Chloroflexota bacterium]